NPLPPKCPAPKCPAAGPPKPPTCPPPKPRPPTCPPAKPPPARPMPSATPCRESAKTMMAPKPKTRCENDPNSCTEKFWSRRSDPSSGTVRARGSGCEQGREVARELPFGEDRPAAVAARGLDPLDVLVVDEPERADAT